MINKINIGDIRKEKSIDRHGFVFVWQNRLFRAIYPSAEEHIKNLFDCGLIRELVSLNIFPESSFVDYSMEGINLIVEHRLIKRVTYQTEWSFSMLRDAVKTIVLVNMVARKYGCQTIDAHCDNVVFDKGQPQFIDLCSFVPLEQPPERKKLSWRAYEEFLYASWLPLKTWKRGKKELARKSLFCCGIGRQRLFLENHGCGLFPEKLVRGVFFIFIAYKTVPALPDNLIAEFLCRTPITKKVARFIIWAKNTFHWPFSGIDLERFYHKLKVLKKGAIASPPDTQNMENDDLKSLDTVVSLINQYGIKSITEIGSRNGATAKAILSKTQVMEIVCIDSDESYVDASYAMIKQNNLPITPVLMDLKNTSEKVAYCPPWDRLKSEAVLAMAINPLFVMIHFRSLAAGFEQLALYSCKYIFVEFISIRLYREISGCGPSEPDRYVVDWLRSIFEQYFDLCFEKQVEPDAIVFAGKLKRKPSSMAAE